MRFTSAVFLPLFLDPSIYVVMLYEIVGGGWFAPEDRVVSSLRPSTTIIGLSGVNKCNVITKDLSLKFSFSFPGTHSVLKSWILVIILLLSFDIELTWFWICTAFSVNYRSPSLAAKQDWTFWHKFSLPFSSNWTFIFTTKKSWRCPEFIDDAKQNFVDSIGNRCVLQM